MYANSLSLTFLCLDLLFPGLNLTTLHPPLVEPVTHCVPLSESLSRQFLPLMKSLARVAEYPGLGVLYICVSSLC